MNEIMPEDGLAWLTHNHNEFFGEVCLCFLTSTINCTIHYTKDIKGDSRNSIVFTTINMCRGSNNCGCDHNHLKLQAVTEDVLVEVLKHCPNAKTFFFGQKPKTNTL